MVNKCVFLKREMVGNGFDSGVYLFCLYYIFGNSVSSVYGSFIYNFVIWVFFFVWICFRDLKKGRRSEGESNWLVWCLQSKSCCVFKGFGIFLVGVFKKRVFGGKEIEKGEGFVFVMIYGYD